MGRFGHHDDNQRLRPRPLHPHSRRQACRHRQGWCADHQLSAQGCGQRERRGPRPDVLYFQRPGRSGRQDLPVCAGAAGAPAHLDVGRQGCGRSCAGELCRHAAGSAAAAPAATNRRRCRQAAAPGRACRRLRQIHAPGLRLARPRALCRIPRRGPHHDPVRGQGAAGLRRARTCRPALGQGSRLAHREWRHGDRLQHRVAVGLSRFPRRQSYRARYPGAEDRCGGLQSAERRQGRCAAPRDRHQGRYRRRSAAQHGPGQCRAQDRRSGQRQVCHPHADTEAGRHCRPHRRKGRAPQPCRPHRRRTRRPMSRAMARR